MRLVADLIAALGKTHADLTPDERVAIDTVYWTAYLAAHPAPEPPPPAPPPPRPTPTERRRTNARNAKAQAKADRIFRTTWAEKNWRPTPADTTKDEEQQRSRTRKPAN